jgi:O-antigen/teichoic acid export membrane protein
MSTTQTIARNVVWNWMDTAAHMVAGFVVAPFLLRQLGETGYGLWVLVASMTGYLDLLDLGLRGSLGRNIAFCHAKEDREGVNAVVTTGMALLLLGSAAVLLVTFLVRFVFFWVFPNVPAEAVGDVDLALILIGINLALIFPLSVFDAVLWANQRFDLLNGIDIPSVILRAALTFALVGTESSSFVVLGLILIVVTLLDGAVTIFCAYRVDPGLRIHPRFLRWSIAGQLFDFGIWYFLLSAARIVSARLGQFLIGGWIAIALVTPFNFASQLVNYVRSVLIASTGVLTPLATAWHAQEKHEQQRWMFVEGGKVCVVVTLFFLGGFLFLGESFLTLWTGRMEYAAALLIILYAGEMLPQSQHVTFNTVLGMNRHRFWACLSILDLGLVIGLAAFFLWLYPDNDATRVYAVALAIAVPGTVCRGLVQIVYACRLLNVSVGAYARRAMLFPTLAAIPAIAVLGVATSCHQPANWFELFLFGAIYGLLFVALTVVVVFGIGPTRELTYLMWLRLRGNRSARSQTSVAEPAGPPVEATPTQADEVVTESVSAI